MNAARFLDTNILLYSISSDPRDVEKRSRAGSLIDEGSWGLSVQVLQEFYVQATRPTRLGSLPHDIAAQLIRYWMVRPLQELTGELLLRALALKEAYGFSYWDSAIVAAALNLGCRELCTEDMSHGQRIEGLTIVNPFVRRS